MSYTHKILIAAAVLGTSAAAYFIFRKPAQPKPLFETTRPRTKSLTQKVSATGTLRARDEITVGSLLAGRIISIDADDNDEVKKGQQLALIDNGIGDSAVKQLQASVKIQQALLTYQEAFFARQKSLYDAGQLSDDTFEQVRRDFFVQQARVKQAEAELEMRRKEYENLFIRAPEDGIVIARKVDLGQMVTAQLQATELFMIALDLHQMEAHIDVDEADIGMVKQGQKVLFSVDAFPRQEFEARVKQIQYLARIVESIVTYAVELDVDNPDLLLRPGMTTNVEIIVGQADDALSVNNAALRVNKTALKRVAGTLGYTFAPLEQDTDRVTIDHVWVARGTRFEQVAVTTGISDRAFTQITRGINAADDLIIDVVEPEQENPLLKQVFGGAGGGIGKK